MFSFHKPKIYRSTHGCCICRAKSSSSRFTDSCKYEREFEKCFRIREERSGEICNACVLLVKRWKKLPDGTNRHWNHVVDARAGPGTKSALKTKNKSPLKFKKHKKIKKIKDKQRTYTIPSPTHLSDEFSGDENSNQSLLFPPRKRSLSLSDDTDNEDSRDSTSSSSRRKRSPSRNAGRVSSFLDLSYWKKTQVCCGTIFKGLNGEVLLDPKLFRPCLTCAPDKVKAEIHRSQSVETESNASSQSYTDSDFLDSRVPSEVDLAAAVAPAAFSLERLTCAASKLEASFAHQALAMEC